MLFTAAIAGDVRGEGQETIKYNFFKDLSFQSFLSGQGGVCETKQKLGPVSQYGTNLP